ncbi:MAG: hypothetical protein UR26_C0001G0070 [candidate division TM6 bacterium GW2011_GWF2_32_72]|nr:MAG: hypothetical protein UR26_C0001G0070 [candidate division TM6 bacterium GW2011_GWF2_32_72]
MKIKTLVILTSLFLTSYARATRSELLEQKTFLGSVDSISKSPLKLYAYFNGNQIEFDNESFLIQSKKNSTLYYIFTEDFKHKTDENTVQFLETCGKTLLFKLEPQPETDLIDKKMIWDITKIESSDGIKIPENAIVFLMPSKTIKKVETEKFCLDDTILKLPKIYLNHDISQSELQDIQTMGALKSLKFKNTHPKVAKEEKTIGKSSMQLTQNNSIYDHA